MFDRFTERARRVVFFARYEASLSNSGSVEAEHLLLGALRECKQLGAVLTTDDVEAIRRTIPPGAEAIPASVDIPLSKDAKRALIFAIEEADGAHHESVDCGHLILGLLRLQNSAAADALRKRGIDLESYRAVVKTGGPRKEPAREAPEHEREWEETERAVAPSLRASVDTLRALVDGFGWQVDRSDAGGERILKRKNLRRKEALGHLIDWATTHHQWIARALAEGKLTAAEYPDESWARAQDYGGMEWKNIIEAWIAVNWLLAGVLARIPEEKLGARCRIGIQEPVTLAQLIITYVAHCEDLIAQILTRE